MLDRQEMVKLLEPVLEDCQRHGEWIDSCTRTDVDDGFKEMANDIQQVINSLREPDPKVISLLRAINQFDETIKGYTKTLHLIAANINKARLQLIEDANYNEVTDAWIKTNTKETHNENQD